MSYNKILYEKQDHVVTITINRPEFHNCIDNETNLELQDAFKTFRHDDDAFVAIYTGEGSFNDPSPRQNFNQRRVRAHSRLCEPPCCRDRVSG